MARLAVIIEKITTNFTWMFFLMEIMIRIKSIESQIILNAAKNKKKMKVGIFIHNLRKLKDKWSKKVYFYVLNMTLFCTNKMSAILNKILCDSQCILIRTDNNVVFTTFLSQKLFIEVTFDFFSSSLIRVLWSVIIHRKPFNLYCAMKKDLHENFF